MSTNDQPGAGKKVYLIDSEPSTNNWECFSLKRSLPGAIIRSAFSADRALEMLGDDLPIDFLSVAGSANSRGRGEPTLVEEVLTRKILAPERILIYSSAPALYQELATRLGIGLLSVNPNHPRLHAEYVAQRLNGHKHA